MWVHYNTTKLSLALSYPTCTFFESRCLSTTSGTPSRKNSSTALFPLREKRRDLFFSRPYAAAVQTRSGSKCQPRTTSDTTVHTHFIHEIGLPLVLVQSRETSFTAKSTSNAAICSRKISRCLIKNNWASTGFCTGRWNNNRYYYTGIQ